MEQEHGTSAWIWRFIILMLLTLFGKVMLYSKIRSVYHTFSEKGLPLPTKRLEQNAWKGLLKLYICYAKRWISEVYCLRAKMIDFQGFVQELAIYTTEC